SSPLSARFMTAGLKLFQPRLFCAVALGVSSPFSLAAVADNSTDPDCLPAGTAPAKTSAAIPWSQLGANPGAEYKSGGLAVMPTAAGARLTCVFQRLEAEATPEGLWLTSTVDGSKLD